MELVIVNGSNAIARGVVSRLAGKQYSKIRLLDFRPYRQSVYNFQRQLPQGVSLEKRQVQNAAALEHGIEGASEVIYFTHDYTANAADKNSFLVGTAKLAKRQGVKKLLAVCPVENELYYTEDAKQPLQKQVEAQADALKSNPDMAILNTDLVYGRHANLLHYMAQCAEAGRIPSAIGNAKGHKFRPVAEQDLANAVQHALSNFSSVKGQNYLVNGADEATLSDLLTVIEGVVGKGQGSTSKNNSLLRLRLSDYLEEFFVGITADKNFRNFAEDFEAHRTNIADGRVNYHEQHGLQRESKGIRETYQALKLTEEDLILPTFTDYKLSALN